MNRSLDELIAEGKTFTFETNSKKSHTVTYRGTHSTTDTSSVSQATPAYIGWSSEVISFVKSNYGETSPPAAILKNYNPASLNGYSQQGFERNHSYLMGALEYCKKMPEPNKVAQPTTSNNVSEIKEQKKPEEITEKKSFKEKIEHHALYVIIGVGIACYGAGWLSYREKLKVSHVDEVPQGTYILNEQVKKEYTNNQDIPRLYVSRDELIERYVHKVRYDSLLKVNQGLRYQIQRMTP